MKKNKLVILALAVVMLFAFAACTTDTPEQADATSTPTPEGEITAIVMGTNAEFPPFEYIGDDGKVDGFDAALVKEISERIGAELTIENMEFKSLIGSLGNGKIDLIAAGMTVTEDRKAEVDFSKSYFTATQRIIVPVGSDIKSGADLEGKIIGVQEGTTGDLIVSEDDVEEADKEYKVKEVKRFKKGIDAVMDLTNGRVDAVVIDSNPSKEYVKANEGKIIDIDSDMEPEEYAIAVKKGNSQLLEKINEAIDEIKADGTYDKLVKEYIQ